MLLQGPTSSRPAPACGVLLRRLSPGNLIEAAPGSCVKRGPGRPRCGAWNSCDQQERAVYSTDYKKLMGYCCFYACVSVGRMDRSPTRQPGQRMGRAARRPTVVSSRQTGLYPFGVSARRRKSAGAVSGACRQPLTRTPSTPATTAKPGGVWGGSRQNARSILHNFMLSWAYDESAPGQNTLRRCSE